MAIEKEKKLGHACTPTSGYARGGGGFLYFLLGAPLSPLENKRGKGGREGGKGYHLMDR